MQLNLNAVLLGGLHIFTLISSGLESANLTRYEGQDSHMQCSTLTNISLCTTISWYKYNYHRPWGVHDTSLRDEFIFVWRKDEELVMNSPDRWDHWRFSPVDGHLYTRNTSLTDDGRFLCIAECSDGMIYDFTDLQVKSDQSLIGEYSVNLKKSYWITNTVQFSPKLFPNNNSLHSGTNDLVHTRTFNKYISVCSHVLLNIYMISFIDCGIQGVSWPSSKSMTIRFTNVYVTKPQ